MAKAKIMGDDDVSGVDLRATSAREKIWLKEFAEKYLEDNEDVTHVELLEAKRVGLLRFRGSARSNISCATDCACEMLDEAGDDDE